MNTWTYKKRLKLYKALVNDFGPYKEWEILNTPTEKRKNEYDKFCNNIARTLGAESDIEIKVEIAYALSKNDIVYKKHARAWFENKCAAMTAKFINDSYMPIEMTCVYEQET